MGRRLPHRRRAGGDRGPGDGRRSTTASLFDREDGAGRPDRDVAPRADPRVRGAGRRTRRTSATPRSSGSTVLTPLFRVPVPVVAHELAEPEKGTGIAMICTFGDLTDVTWWRELDLPLRVVIETGRHGSATATSARPAGRSRDPAAANAAMAELTGLSVKKARGRVAEMLREAGALVGEPEPVRHAVKFYEKGERPLEVITSRQWFVPTLRYRDRLLERGAELSLASRLHGRPLRVVGREPEPGLVHQPAAVLRRAVPRLVPDRRAASASGTTSRSSRMRPRSRSIRRATSLPASPPSSAACPGGSSAIRT